MNNSRAARGRKEEQTVLEFNGMRATEWARVSRIAETERKDKKGNRMNAIKRRIIVWMKLCCASVKYSQIISHLSVSHYRDDSPARCWLHHLSRSWFSCFFFFFVFHLFFFLIICFGTRVRSLPPIEMFKSDEIIGNLNFSCAWMHKVF